MKKSFVSLFFQYLLLLTVAVTVNFFIVYLVPGDVVDMMSRGLTEIGTDRFTEETRQILRQYFGLDQPIFTQFINYLRGLFVGDLGMSFFYRKPVTEIVFEYAARTLILITSGIGLALLVGIPLGTFSAAHRGKKADSFLLFSQIMLHSIPPFLIAMFLLIVFAVILKWFPFAGSGKVGQIFSINDIQYLVLPVASLFLWEVTTIYYFTRNTLVDILGEEFILVARAKGLSERVILFRHALRGAMPTLIARFALLFGTAVGGVFFIENVFSYPGIASLALMAFQNYDYTLLRGIFLLLTVSILAVNFIADVCLYKLDPRASASR